MKRGGRWLVFGLIGLSLAATAGCFGRFRVVSAVYDFNRGIENKFLRSLVMWAMIIIPVYPVAGLADVLIFNVIEFWGGGSGLAEAQTLPDGSVVETARVSPTVLRVRITDAAGRPEMWELVKVSERAGYLRRPGGAILATVEQTADGRIVSRGP